MARLTLILPCRNESANLPLVLAEIEKAFAEELKPLSGRVRVLVVDNQSTDGSGRIAASHPWVQVVSCLEPGYGVTLRTGFQQVSKIQPEEGPQSWVFMFDCDGTYSAKVASQWWARVVAGEWQDVDLILGDRLNGQIQRGAMPFLHRYLGTPLLSLFLRLRFRSLAKVRDCNSGFRLMRSQALQGWGLQSHGMELASEMLMKAARSGARVHVEPIPYRKSFHARQGHLRPWRDGLRHLLMISISPRSLTEN